ncbi:MAG: hypothetical protein LJE93_17275 [Acidobacteria bacterium]|jgi:hypothetical protein|nr:hypothetical protein [Acidobacteriota bacterium]
MSIWSSIFGPRPGSAPAVEISPSGLLMDSEGWYYEESLDPDCPKKTIRVRQDRPGNWYVRNTNCRIEGLNNPARAAEVLGFFTGSFRWLHFECDLESRRQRSGIRVIGTYLDPEGRERDSHLGYVYPDVCRGIVGLDVQRLWGRLRCIRPPGNGLRPTFCLRFDLLVELDETMFDEDGNKEARCGDSPNVPS